MTSAHEFLRQYLTARGLPMPDGASARKVAEEAVELVEEAMVAKIDLDIGRDRPERAPRPPA